MLLSVTKSVICPIVVGRALHLATLKEFIAGAQQSRGMTLILSGEAGIGKSRLVAEAKILATTMGLTVLQGRCFESDSKIPYAPLLDLLRSVFAAYSSRELTELLSPYATALIKLLPELAILWPELTLAAPIDPEQEKRRLAQVLTQFFIAYASPLLIVIEDLHWCDDTSLEFLLYLARRLSNHPIALLLTYRSDETHVALERCLASLQRERLAHELGLEPLTPTNMNEMLCAIFEQSRPVHPEFNKTLYTLTNGNPFFIEEILKALVTEGDIYFEQGIWTRKPLSELRIPRTLQDAVQRRIEKLGKSARVALTFATAIGQRFDFTLLAAVTQQSEDALLKIIRELVDSQLIVEESADHFVFRHALTRKAIYDQLLERERRPYHRLIAESLERLYAGQIDRAADCAYQFHAAGIWEKALLYAQQAGERAQQLHAPRAAAENFTLAIAAVQALATHPYAPADPQITSLVALYYARGKAYDLLGEFIEAEADYIRAVELAHNSQDAISEWQSLLSLGFLYSRRDYAQAHLYLQRALALVRTIQQPALLGETLNRLGNWYANCGQPERAIPYHHEALALFQANDDKRGLAATLDLLGSMHLLNADSIAAARCYTEAIKLLRELGDDIALSSALAMNNMTRGSYLSEAVVSLSGTTVGCVREGEESLRLARRSSSPPVIAYSLLQFAFCLGARGDFDRTLDLGRECLAISTEQEHTHFLAAINYVLGSLYLDFLAFEQAKQYFAVGLPFAQSVGSPIMMGMLSGGMALALIACRELADVEIVLDGVHFPPAELHHPGIRITYLARAEYYFALGKPQIALDLTQQLIASTPNVATGGIIPRLWRLKAACLIALKQTDEAEVLLREASQVAREQGLLHNLWRSEVALGNIFRLRSQRHQAEQHYGQASAVIQTLAQKISDDSIRTCFVERATSLIPAFPTLSPAQVEKAAFNGLTPRERDVATLLAQGLSNKAIATKLVLSERTVEKHIENVMGKLGFTSRAQAAVWAAEHGLR